MLYNLNHFLFFLLLNLSLLSKKIIRRNHKQPEKCKLCDYKTKNTFLMKKHILNKHSTKEVREKEFKFYCSYCDFGTFSKDTIKIPASKQLLNLFNILPSLSNCIILYFLLVFIILLIVSFFNFFPFKLLLILFLVSSLCCFPN